MPPTFPPETAPAAHCAASRRGRHRLAAFFADPRLKRLIELALQNNRDLRVAVLNIEQARAQYQIQRADELPTRGRRRDRRSASPAATATAAACYTVGLSVTGYELDLFGRVRSLSDAALAQYLGHRGSAQGGADQPDRRRSPTPI